MARDYDHLFKLLIIGDSGELLDEDEFHPSSWWARLSENVFRMLPNLPLLPSLSRFALFF